MAIYKPTACQPSLTSLDLTELPIILECKLDTSNTKVDAYSIKLLDQDNNVIFPYGYNEETFVPSLSNISLISDIPNSYVGTFINNRKNVNTGLNGTYLLIPFIFNATSFPGSTFKYNALKFYSNAIVDNDNNSFSSKIFNGGAYKWEITLYQLEENS